MHGRIPLELLRRTCGLPLDLSLHCFSPQRGTLLRTRYFLLQSWPFHCTQQHFGLGKGRGLVNLLISLVVSAKIFPSPARTAPPLPAIVEVIKINGQASQKEKKTNHKKRERIRRTHFSSLGFFLSSLLFFYINTCPFRQFSVV